MASLPPGAERDHRRAGSDEQAVPQGLCLAGGYLGVKDPNSPRVFDLAHAVKAVLDVKMWK